MGPGVSRPNPHWLDCPQLREIKEDIQQTARFLIIVVDALGVLTAARTLVVGMTVVLSVVLSTENAGQVAEVALRPAQLHARFEVNGEPVESAM